MEQKKSEKKKDDVVEKWDTFGMLTGVEDNTKTNLAYLYERLAHYILDTNTGYEHNSRIDEATGIVFPVVGRLFVDYGVKDHKDVLYEFLEWFMSLDETPNEKYKENKLNYNTSLREEDEEVINDFVDHYLTYRDVGTKPTKWFDMEQISTYVGDDLEYDVNNNIDGHGKLIVLHQCGDDKKKLIGQLKTMIHKIEIGGEYFAS